MFWIRDFDCSAIRTMRCILFGVPLPEQYWQFAPGIEKWCAPIASVAALTAQPLAALPPYGCGVPLAGIERLVREYSTAGECWCTAALP